MLEIECSTCGAVRALFPDETGTIHCYSCNAPLDRGQARTQERRAAARPSTTDRFQSSVPVVIGVVILGLLSISVLQILRNRKETAIEQQEEAIKGEKWAEFGTMASGIEFKGPLDPDGPYLKGPLVVFRIGTSPTWQRDNSIESGLRIQLANSPEEAAMAVLIWSQPTNSAAYTSGGQPESDQNASITALVYTYTVAIVNVRAGTVGIRNKRFEAKLPDKIAGGAGVFSRQREFTPVNDVISYLNSLPHRI